MIAAPIQVDSNILLRSAQPPHPAFGPTAQGLAKLRTLGCTLHILPQNFYEFWVVATRPVGQNGLGMSPAQASADLARLKSLFIFLEDPPGLYGRWEHLVGTHAVSGKEAHDARLVATMLLHGLSHILTFNDTDFARYASDGIVALVPRKF